MRALCAAFARVTRLSATCRETARPDGGRVCRPICVACALLRSAGLLVFRRMSAPARDAFLIYPSGGLGRRCWFVRSLSFRFRFCRQIHGAGPCGLFILPWRATERCGPALISGIWCGTDPMLARCHLLPARTTYAQESHASVACVRLAAHQPAHSASFCSPLLLKTSQRPADPVTPAAATAAPLEARPALCFLSGFPATYRLPRSFRVCCCDGVY